MSGLKVLAVSSWGMACGIANHTDLVREAIEAADPGISITVDARALDPQAFWTDARNLPDIVWLNHHDALHSRWTAEHLSRLGSIGVKTLVTYHDTRETMEQCPKLSGLALAASHTIVHEPVDGLADLTTRTTYLRQGIPELPGRIEIDGIWQRPYLGTAGFDFPWKNYTKLAQLTAEIGWGLMIVSPNLSEERAQELSAINPHCSLHLGFRPTNEILMRLGGCTATAWMYECANTGTSGAIRLGIAARKPVFAPQGCRQFRDLRLAESGRRRLINWVDGWPHLRELLIHSWPVDIDPAMVYLAERDSMTKVGLQYAVILRSL